MNKMIKLILLMGLVSLSVLNNTWASTSTIDIAKLSKLNDVEEVTSTQKNQRALVYFWATWCPDCRSKLKGELKELHQKGVRIFTINKDSVKRKAEKFIDKHKIALPVYLDKEKVISMALKAFSVPHWSVIEHQEDKDGKKIWRVLKYGSGNIEPAKEILQLNSN